MTFLKIVKLLMQADKWELGFLEDELKLRPGTLSFYAESPTRFRHIWSGNVVYEVGFCAWLVIWPLSLILLYRVKEREKR